MKNPLNLAVNPKAPPTPEQMTRSQIADRLFEFHNQFNRNLGAAALNIMGRAPIAETLDALRLNIESLLRLTMDELGKIQKAS